MISGELKANNTCNKCNKELSSKSSLNKHYDNCNSNFLEETKGEAFERIMEDCKEKEIVFFYQSGDDDHEENIRRCGNREIIIIYKKVKNAPDFVIRNINIRVRGINLHIDKIVSDNEFEAMSMAMNIQFVETFRIIILEVIVKFLLEEKNRNLILINEDYENFLYSLQYEIFKRISPPEIEINKPVIKRKKPFINNPLYKYTANVNIKTLMC